MVHPPKNEPHSIQKPVNSCTNPQGSSHSAKFSSFGTGKETTSRSHMSELGWCGSSLPCYPRGVAGVAPKLHGSQPEREVDQTRQGNPCYYHVSPSRDPIGPSVWKPGSQRWWVGAGNWYGHHWTVMITDNLGKRPRLTSRLTYRCWWHLHIWSSPHMLIHIIIISISCSSNIILM